MQTEFTQEPEAIKYMKLSDGKADVWLRQNITESVQNYDGVESTIWTADEVYFRTTLAEEEIADNFETIFENGGATVDEETGEETADGITLATRVEALEDGLADLAEVLMEVMG